MNTDTDSECRLAGVLTAIVTRILGLRGSSGHRNGSCFQRMDVKSAFRQVSVAPDRAGAGAYRWRISIRRPPIAVSGGKGARVVGVASAIQEAHRTTTWASAGTSAAAIRAINRVGVAEPTGEDVEPSPPRCRVPKVRGGGERDRVGDIRRGSRHLGKSPMEGGRRAVQALTASLEDAHFQAVPEYGEHDGRAATEEAEGL